MSDPQALDDLVANVQAMLADTRPVDGPRRCVDARATARAAYAHGVGVHLSLASSDVVDPELVRALAEPARAARLRSMVVAATAVDVVRTLERGGVACLVMKGVAMALLTTGTVDGRGAGDIDVLISPGDLSPARKLLEAAGWTLVGSPEVYTAGPVRRHVMRATHYETQFVRAGQTLDLHWGVGAGHHHMAPVGELLERRVRLPFGPDGVPAFERTDAAVHQAAHWLGSTLVPLKQAIDLVRLGPMLDGAAVDALTPGARRVLGRGHGLAWAVLGRADAEPPAWSLPPSRALLDTWRTMNEAWPDLPTQRGTWRHAIGFVDRSRLTGLPLRQVAARAVWWVACDAQWSRIAGPVRRVGASWSARRGGAIH